MRTIREERQARDPELFVRMVTEDEAHIERAKAKRERVKREAEEETRRQEEKAKAQKAHLIQIGQQAKNLDLKMSVAATFAIIGVWVWSLACLV